MLKIVSKGNFQSINEFTFVQNKKLGSGSFGTVRLAIHNLTSKMYALKIISLCDLPTQSQIKLVQRQIKLHSQLDHPHIIKVWDTFNDNDNIYMVMQYAQMGNLFYYQNTKNIFSQPQAFKFFTQTLTAISYLHNNDIIHRDLKPQNLLLDKYLNLKICDFGWCAQCIHQKRNTFCGTYQYMAPEMIFKHQYDYRIDIWALGILLYQMLHGYAPFKGKTTEEVQQSMKKGTYQINPKLSSSVKKLIQQILQFKLSQRLSIQQIFQHSWMKQMSQTIKDYLKQQKVSLPQQIQPKLCKMPISLLKLRTLKKNSQSQRRFHRKNNSMNLQQQQRNNININLSINNFSISNTNNINKKNKKQFYHSQDKFCQKYQKEVQQFDILKQNQINHNKFNINNNNTPNLKIKNKKSQIRCKTLVDEQTKIQKQKISQIKSKFINNMNNMNQSTHKKLSKDNLFDHYNYNNQSTMIIKKNDSKIMDINFMKKNFKLRKSQDKIDKPIRFNTQAYDKQDQSYMIKLKKNAKKRKILTSTKNLKMAP